MKFKTTQALMAVASIVAGMSLPALAQSAVPLTSDDKSANTARFERKLMVAHGKGAQCERGSSDSRFGHGGPRGKSHHKHQGGMFSSLKGEFALTQDQYEKLFTIKKQLKDQAAPKVAELKTEGQKMRDLMTQPDIDKSQLLSLQSRINGAKDSLSTIMLENKLQQLSVLTSAQRQELRKKFVERSVNSRRG